MKKHFGAFFALGALLLMVAACSGSFTTANISKLEFGKNETASPATTSFDINDKMYAVATVSNTSEKLKMAFKVTAENVAGATKGQEVISKSIDFEGARPIWLQFTVNKPGEFRVETVLTDETGKEIDKKSGTVTVTGSAAPPAATTDKKDDDEDDEKN